jgi:hypothetical protein
MIQLRRPNGRTPPSAHSHIGTEPAVGLGGSPLASKRSPLKPPTESSAVDVHEGGAEIWWTSFLANWVRSIEIEDYPDKAQSKVQLVKETCLKFPIERWLQAQARDSYNDAAL